MTIPERMRRLRRLTGLLTPAEAAAEGRSTDGVSGRLDAMQQRQRFAEVVSAALTVSFIFLVLLDPEFARVLREVQSLKSELGMM